MLNKLVPITVITALGLGLGAAAFAETATGTVAQVSETCDGIMLTDGSSFRFGDEAKADVLHCFKPGDQVSITWRHVGDKMEAISISPVSAKLDNTGVGVIAEIDAACDRVTLTDGTTVAFRDTPMADRLHCFKPGDEVSLTWTHVGDRLEGVAISPVSEHCVAEPVERLHECDRTDD